MDIQSISFYLIGKYILEDKKPSGKMRSTKQKFLRFIEHYKILEKKVKKFGLYVDKTVI